MVKGISRQVIVVHSPDPQLFEQAIFILKDNAQTQQGITDEALLREAKALIRHPAGTEKRGILDWGPLWACGGATIMGLVWLVSSFL